MKHANTKDDNIQKNAAGFMRCQVGQSNLRNAPSIGSRQKMAVWTDIRELIFPWCTDSECQVVKHALKQISNYPASEEVMHECTHAEQQEFLKAYQAVHTGALLVDIQHFLKSMQPFMHLADEVTTQHNKSKEPVVVLCNKMKDDKKAEDLQRNKSCNVFMTELKRKGITCRSQRLVPALGCCVATDESKQVKSLTTRNGKATSSCCYWARKRAQRRLGLNSASTKFYDAQLITSAEIHAQQAKTLMVPFQILQQTFPFAGEYLYHIARNCALPQGLRTSRAVFCSLDEARAINRLLYCISREEGEDLKWKKVTSSSLLVPWSEFISGLKDKLKSNPSLTSASFIVLHSQKKSSRNCSKASSTITQPEVTPNVKVSASLGPVPTAKSDESEKRDTSNPTSTAAKGEVNSKIKEIDHKKGPERQFKDKTNDKEITNDSETVVKVVKDQLKDDDKETKVRERHLKNKTKEKCIRKDGETKDKSKEKKGKTETNSEPVCELLPLSQGKPVEAINAGSELKGQLTSDHLGNDVIYAIEQPEMSSEKDTGRDTCQEKESSHISYLEKDRSIWSVLGQRDHYELRPRNVNNSASETSILQSTSLDSKQPARTEINNSNRNDRCFVPTLRPESTHPTPETDPNMEAVHTGQGISTGVNQACQGYPVNPNQGQSNQGQCRSTEGQGHCSTQSQCYSSAPGQVRVPRCSEKARCSFFSMLLTDIKQEEDTSSGDLLWCSASSEKTDSMEKDLQAEIADTPSSPKVDLTECCQENATENPSCLQQNQTIMQTASDTGSDTSASGPSVEASIADTCDPPQTSSNTDQIVTATSASVLHSGPSPTKPIISNQVNIVRVLGMQNLRWQMHNAPKMGESISQCEVVSRGVSSPQQGVSERATAVPTERVVRAEQEYAIAPLNTTESSEMPGPIYSNLLSSECPTGQGGVRNSPSVSGKLFKGNTPSVQSKASKGDTQINRPIPAKKSSKRQNKSNSKKTDNSQRYTSQTLLKNGCYIKGTSATQMGVMSKSGSSSKSSSRSIIDIQNSRKNAAAAAEKIPKTQSTYSSVPEPSIGEKVRMIEAKFAETLQVNTRRSNPAGRDRQLPFRIVQKALLHGGTQGDKPKWNRNSVVRVSSAAAVDTTVPLNTPENSRQWQDELCEGPSLSVGGNSPRANYGPSTSTTPDIYEEFARKRKTKNHRPDQSTPVSSTPDLDEDTAGRKASRSKQQKPQEAAVPRKRSQTNTRHSFAYTNVSPSPLDSMTVTSMQPKQKYTYGNASMHNLPEAYHAAYQEQQKIFDGGEHCGAGNDHSVRPSVSLESLENLSNLVNINPLRDGLFWQIQSNSGSGPDTSSQHNSDEGAFQYSSGQEARRLWDRASNTHLPDADNAPDETEGTTKNAPEATILSQEDILQANHENVHHNDPQDPNNSNSLGEMGNIVPISQLLPFIDPQTNELQMQDWISSLPPESYLMFIPNTEEQCKVPGCTRKAQSPTRLVRLADLNNIQTAKSKSPKQSNAEMCCGSNIQDIASCDSESPKPPQTVRCHDNLVDTCQESSRHTIRNQKDSHEADLRRYRQQEKDEETTDSSSYSNSTSSNSTCSVCSSDFDIIRVEINGVKPKEQSHDDGDMSCSSESVDSLQALFQSLERQINNTDIEGQCPCPQVEEHRVGSVSKEKPGKESEGETANMSQNILYVGSSGKQENRVDQRPWGSLTKRATPRSAKKSSICITSKAPITSRSVTRRKISTEKSKISLKKTSTTTKDQTTRSKLKKSSSKIQTKKFPSYTVIPSKSSEIYRKNNCETESVTKTTDGNNVNGEEQCRDRLFISLKRVDDALAAGKNRQATADKNANRQTKSCTLQQSGQSDVSFASMVDSQNSQSEMSPNSRQKRKSKLRFHNFKKSKSKQPENGKSKKKKVRHIEHKCLKKTDHSPSPKDKNKSGVLNADVLCPDDNTKTLISIEREALIFQNKIKNDLKSKSGPSTRKRAGNYVWARNTNLNENAEIISRGSTSREPAVRVKKSNTRHSLVEADNTTESEDRVASDQLHESASFIKSQIKEKNESKCKCTKQASSSPSTCSSTYSSTSTCSSTSNSSSCLIDVYGAGQYSGIYETTSENDESNGEQGSDTIVYDVDSHNFDDSKDKMDKNLTLSNANDKDSKVTKKHRNLTKGTTEDGKCVHDISSPDPSPESFAGVREHDDLETKITAENENTEPSKTVKSLSPVQSQEETNSQVFCEYDSCSVDSHEEDKKPVVTSATQETLGSAALDPEAVVSPAAHDEDYSRDNAAVLFDNGEDTPIICIDRNMNADRHFLNTLLQPDTEYISIVRKDGDWVFIPSQHPQLQEALHFLRSYPHLNFRQFGPVSGSEPSEEETQSSDGLLQDAATVKSEPEDIEPEVYIDTAELASDYNLGNDLDSLSCSGCEDCCEGLNNYDHDGSEEYAVWRETPEITESSKVSQKEALELVDCIKQERDESDEEQLVVCTSAEDLGTTVTAESTQSRETNETHLIQCMPDNSDHDFIQDNHLVQSVDHGSKTVTTLSVSDLLSVVVRSKDSETSSSSASNLGEEMENAGESRYVSDQESNCSHKYAEKCTDVNDGSHELQYAVSNSDTNQSPAVSSLTLTSSSICNIEPNMNNLDYICMETGVNDLELSDSQNKADDSEKEDTDDLLNNLQVSETDNSGKSEDDERLNQDYEPDWSQFIQEEEVVCFMSPSENQSDADTRSSFKSIDSVGTSCQNSCEAEFCCNIATNPISKSETDTNTAQSQIIPGHKPEKPMSIFERDPNIFLRHWDAVYPQEYLPAPDSSTSLDEEFVQERNSESLKVYDKDIARDITEEEANKIMSAIYKTRLRNVDESHRLSYIEEECEEEDLEEEGQEDQHIEKGNEDLSKGKTANVSKKARGKPRLSNNSAKKSKPKPARDNYVSQDIAELKKLMSEFMNKDKTCSADQSNEDGVDRDKKYTIQHSKPGKKKKEIKKRGSKSSSHRDSQDGLGQLDYTEDEATEVERSRIAAEGFIKTQQRYLDIIQKQLATTSEVHRHIPPHDENVNSTNSADIVLDTDTREFVEKCSNVSLNSLTKYVETPEPGTIMPDTDKGRSSTTSIIKVCRLESLVDNPQAQIYVKDPVYQLIADEDDTNLGGIAYHIGRILPFIYINGYRFTTLRDALSYFPHCQSTCTIPRSVLKQHRSLIRSLCTWDQVYKLELIKMKKGPSIKTGDVLIKLDSLISLLPELRAEIARRHSDTKLKRSQSCNIDAMLGDIV